MRQAVVTVILGIVGSLFARELTEINARLEAQNLQRSFLYWLTEFSNGDLLGILQILLICYIYARVREIQKVLPKKPPTSAGIPRIFGF